MSLKNSNIPPYLSIYGIVFFYMMLTGFAMFILLKLEEYEYKHIIGFFEIVAFAFISYSINKYYFSRINLESPKSVGINSTLFKSVVIGILFAALLNFPYRIYATVKSGALEYIILAFTPEEFIKSLGAGIFEEITFRGTLLNFYNQKKKKYLGLVISSAIFCLIHAPNSFFGVDITFFYLLDMFIFGLLFGLIYLNYGLVTAITTHFVGNLLIGGFIQATRYGSYYSFGIALIICIWLFIRDRNKQKISWAN